jgi:hypothetical protein
MLIAVAVLWIVCGIIGLMVKVPRMAESIEKAQGWQAVHQFLIALLIVSFGPLIFFYPKES